MNERIERMKETLKNGGVKVHVSPLLYPTPRWLAEQMAERLSLLPREYCLEPSAGLGALIDVLDLKESYLLAIETDEKLCNVLREKYGNSIDVIHQNFLDFTPPFMFDKIIMNPPFNGGVDIDHIVRAASFLKPGGRLVGICANGPRQNRILKPLSNYWEDLPPDTFESAGTKVNTALLEIVR